MKLTPEQVEDTLTDSGVEWEVGTDFIDTIRDYADIVQRVAEAEYRGHTMNELREHLTLKKGTFYAACKLRGLK